MNTPDNLNRGYEIRETANRWMASFANCTCGVGKT